MIGALGLGPVIGGRVRIVSGCRVDRQNCWGGRCDVSEVPIRLLVTEKLAGKLPMVRPGWWSEQAQRVAHVIGAARLRQQPAGDRQPDVELGVGAW